MNDNLHQRALVAGLSAVENALGGNATRPRKNIITFISQLEDALCNLRTMADVVREQGVKSKDSKIQGEANGIDRAVAILLKTLEQLSSEYIGGAR